MVAFTGRFVLAAVVVPLCIAKQLRLRGNVSDGDMEGGGAFDTEGKKLTVELINDDDISLYATITVGDQHVQCIMDTGSSEQVVFSSKCSDCGGKMYDCDHDSHCEWGKHETVQSYGSGDTVSREAHTDLTATAMNGKKTISVKGGMVWLVTDAQLDFELDGTMQCIFGMAPAKSALDFAKMDIQTVKEYMGEMSKKDAKDWEPTLEQLKEHLSFMKGVTLWQESAKIEVVSVCLHPELGKNGQLIFNDDYPEETPEAFLHAPADGPYWGVSMTDGSIAFHNETVTTCRHGKCEAILDTGTSLIGAPWEVVEDLSRILADLMPQYGCEADAMEKYPDFKFKLGGNMLHLPPRGYVCKFDAGEWDSFEDVGQPGESGQPGQPQGPANEVDRVIHVRQRMRHVHAFREAHRQRRFMAGKSSKPKEGDDETFCAPCFFEMDQIDEGTEQWLFGIPFFREYYTSFVANNYRAAREVLFAKASEQCVPQKIHSKEGKELVHGHGPQHVKLHKLRFPAPRKHAHERVEDRLLKLAKHRRQ